MKKSTKDSSRCLCHPGKVGVIAGKGIKSSGLKAEGKGEIPAGKIQKKAGDAATLE